MSTRIARTAWWLLVGGIAWQAVAGALDAGGGIAKSADVGLAQRLGGTTDDRIARALGTDFAVARALRHVARPGEHALCRVVFDTAAFAEPSGIVPRLTRLRHALFPTPHVMTGGEDPIALGDDPRPAEGNGWRRLHAEPGFEVWRLQR